MTTIMVSTNDSREKVIIKLMVAFPGAIHLKGPLCTANDINNLDRSRVIILSEYENTPEFIINYLVSNGQPTEDNDES